MSIFNDLDVASAKENPFFKPDGDYVCKITKVEARYSKNGNKGLSLEYTIQEGPKKGKFIGEWKNIPEPWEVMGYKTKENFENETNHSDTIQETAERNLAFLKQRMKQFGFTPEEMNDVSPEDLLQVPWLEITLKNEGSDERIKNIVIYADKGEEAVFS